MTDGTPTPQELIRASVDAYLALLEQSPELYRFVVAAPAPRRRHDVQRGRPTRPASPSSSPTARPRWPRRPRSRLGAPLGRGDRRLHQRGRACGGSTIRDAMSPRRSWPTTSPRCSGAAPPGYSSYAGQPGRRRPAPGVFRRLASDATSSDRRPDRRPVDVAAAAQVLDGRWARRPRRARELARDPRFAVDRRRGHRDSSARDVLEQLRALAEAGYSGTRLPGRVRRPATTSAARSPASRCSAIGDLSLLVKAGVQWGLFGGAVLHLGTERHHDALPAPTSSTCELLGCFAMTETGHGSDVATLRTTATYDPATDEFVIDTPDDDARKEYIGNAARDGRLAAVFAQLITGGEAQGVHAFLVPIRDDDGTPMPRRPHRGLRAQGRPQRRRQRPAVLRRRPRPARQPAQPLRPTSPPTARYTTPIENKTKRFFTMLGTLVQGRISVAGGAGQRDQGRADHRDPLRRASAASSPRPAADEIRVLDYLAHQRKLLPALAKTYALHFAQLELVALLHETTPSLDGDRRGRRRARGRPAAPRARGARRRHQGDRAPGTRPRTIQDLPRGLRRRGLPRREPAARPQGRHRRVHHLRGRQHRAAAARRQGAAHRLPRPLRRARLLGHGPLRRRPGRRDRRRDDRRPAARCSACVDAAPGATRRQSLLDRGWQLELFEWREQHLLETLARRLRRAAGADDPFAVFNAAQDHLLGRRAGAHRHGAAAGVRRRASSAARRRRARLLDRGLRPVRAVDHRGRARLVPGARPAHRRPARRR